MKPIHRLSLLWIIIFTFLVSCSAQYEQAYQFNYTFDEDQEGWVAGFADLPADHGPGFFH